jgi:hypothetical protein
MDLAEADKLARETDYALAATHQDTNQINWRDAAAFFIEGYKHAQKEIVEKLQDPHAVRINMLRGTIATPKELNNGRQRRRRHTITGPRQAT